MMALLKILRDWKEENYQARSWTITAPMLMKACVVIKLEHRAKNRTVNGSSLTEALEAAVKVMGEL